MGGYAGSIGDYALYMDDYVFDYVKDGKPKEYYEKYMVDLTLKHYLPGFKNEYSWVVERNKEEWELKVPLLKLGFIKKLRKYYEFYPSYNLQKLLWEEIHKRKIKIEGYIYISNFLENDDEDSDERNIWFYYYLTTPIGDEKIKLESFSENELPPKYILRNYDENMWVHQHGLEFSSKVRE